MGKSCPDHQLLSVYFDGELPSPWKEKLESHANGCPECALRLETYRRNSLLSAEEGETPAESARERIWQKLERRAGPARSRAVWRRSISIPLPAAAAAVLLIALAFLFVLRTTEAPESPGMILASETDFETPGIIPVSDMQDVLHYLGNRDNGELIILRLPESRNFVNHGEPAIIRAADYSRAGMQGGGRR